MPWIVNYAGRVNSNLVFVADFKIACYFPWFSTCRQYLGYMNTTVQLQPIHLDG
jgi:hypothetical protein